MEVDGTYVNASAGLVATVAGPAHTVANTWEDTRDFLLSKTNTQTVGTSSVTSSYGYTVNNIGQRKRVDRDGTEMSAANAIGWDYNTTGELTKEDFNDDSTAGTRDLVFQYDAIGNRQKSAAATLTLGASNYTANALNQYTVANGVTLPVGSVGVVLPAYDADGNYQHGPLPVDYLQDHNATWVWDAENRLVKVTRYNGDVITFAYDHLSRRICKTFDLGGAGRSVVATRFLYDGWNLIAEYTGTALKMTYTWGMDLSGGMQGAGGVGGLLAVSEYPFVSGHPLRTPYFPTFDGNGNVSEYLDDGGVKQAHYEYDAFGNLACAATGTKAGDFSYRFSTKGFDSETGLYYYGYRYYDPLTGRWPSRDPIGENGGMNLYGFVENNGVNSGDYLGRDAFVLTGAPARVPDDDHDKDWRHFITASEVQIQKLIPTLAQGERITWAVAKKGYQSRQWREAQDFEGEIERVAKNFGGSVVLTWVDSPMDVANAFNNTSWGAARDGTAMESAPAPSSSKIRSFFYFGHGTPGQLNMGWNQEGRETPFDWSFTSSDLIYLLEGAITKGCLCVSYGCNSATGTGQDGSGPSFADAWKATFGMTLTAVKGRTSYAPSGRSHSPFYSPQLPGLEAGASWVPQAPN